MYDVIIIGGGVVGCALAHELSRYKLKIVVVEKGTDVCEQTSMANSAVVHSGYDPEPGTLKAKMNVEGSAMMEQVCCDLDVEYQNIGSYTLAFTAEEMETLKALQLRGEVNGVKTILLSKEETLKNEPRVNKSVLGALYAPTCSIVNPFELVVALMENAMDNGAELKLLKEVVAINCNADYYEVVCRDGEKIKGKAVVNAAGNYGGKIAAMIGETDIVLRPRKGAYYVLDHFPEPFVSHVLFPCPSEKGKGVLVTPTTNGNYLIGPSSEYTDCFDDTATDAEDLRYVKEKATKMVDNIPFDKQIRVFAGLRAVSQTADGDFIIEEDKRKKNFYHAVGIQSPGLASSLAIAKRLRELIEKRRELIAKDDYNPRRRPLIRLNKKSPAERDRLIKENPLLGKIVCRCEIVSEGEIVDCIRRNCGATTIRGVKKRARPGFGKCQGGFCEAAVLFILARELKKNPLDIVYGDPDSYILKEETKIEAIEK